MTYDLEISYSLYGSGEMYIKGALNNAKFVPIIYPGATMVVYHDASVPGTALEALRALNVRLIDCSELNMHGHTRMLWRFLSLEKGNENTYMLSRDCDSKPNVRERWCYDHWRENSPNDILFTIRDSSSHDCVPVMGGMFGARKGFKRLLPLIQGYTTNAGCGIDQTWLERILIPFVGDHYVTYYGGTSQPPGHVDAKVVHIPDEVKYDDIHREVTVHCGCLDTGGTE